MSSLTGGFDLVAEIAAPTLLKLIQAKAKFTSAGIPSLETPFQWNISMPVGSVDLIVTGLTLTLQANEMALVTGRFEQSRFVPADLTKPTKFMQGNFSVSVPVKLEVDPSVNTTTKRLFVHMEASTVNFATDGATDPSVPTGAIEFALGLGFQALGVISLPVAFQMAANQGDLATLQFSALEMHSIASTNSLALFASFGSSTGSVQSWAGTLLQSGEGVGLAMSPSTFIAQAVCPSLAGAFGVKVTDLPTVCGTGAGNVTLNGIHIDSVGIGFAAEHIDLNIAFSKSGTGYSATGTVHGALTFDIDGSSLTPKINWDTPDIDVSLDWWAYALSAILGPLGVGIAEVARVAGEHIADAIAKGKLQDATGSLNPFNLGNIVKFGTINLQHAHSAPDGLAIGGSVIPPNAATAKPGVVLQGGTQTSDVQPGQTINLKEEFPPFASYVASDFKTNSVATYTAVTTLLAWKYSVSFFALTGSGTKVPLPANDTVMLNDVTCLMDMGTQHPFQVNKAVKLMVQVYGNQVVIKNDPADGNYSFLLGCTVTDANGITKTAMTSVDIWGEDLILPQSYYNDMQSWQDMNSKIGGKGIPAAPHYPPSPPELAAYLLALVSNPSPEAAQILRTAPATYGATYGKAMVTKTSIPTLDLSGLAGNIRLIGNTGTPQVQTNFTPLKTGIVTQT